MNERRERIVVLLANAENRRLLGDVLGERYDVSTTIKFGARFEIAERTGADFGPFDLCIVDGILLQQHFREVVHLRESYEPLFLPVLLLAERQSTDLRARRLWEAIDDVLFRPLERIELISRVQALLRTRQLSLQARKLTTLYEHEHTIAQRLQEAALPRVPPVLPGLLIDAVYRPADNDARVGGDWYDTLRLPDGRVVVTIGDVSGSGLDAAVTMSQVKQVLRAVAHVHSDPALMLDAAERTLADQEEQKQISVFVGVIDLIASQLTYASAGHPPPLLRDADGYVSALPCDGLLLGTPIRLPRQSLVSEFPTGSMLVMYTDGVTEATRDPVEGERRLRSVFSEMPHDEMFPARTLTDSMRIANANDDVALITIYNAFDEAGRNTLRWEFDSADKVGARVAQIEYREALDVHGLSKAAIETAETILAELLGNVVRYAPGQATVVLDLALRAPVLHVLDRGQGFQYFPKLPHDLLSETGRGLYIVSRLAEEFAVARRSRAGSHARVVLAATARTQRVSSTALGIQHAPPTWSAGPL